MIDSNYQIKITPKRASYLLDERLLGGEWKMSFRQSCDMPTKKIYEDGLTEIEFKEIKLFMMDYPHNCSMTDILVDVSLGIYRVLNTTISLVEKEVRIKHESIDQAYRGKIGKVIEEKMDVYPQYRDSRSFKVKFDEDSLPTNPLIVPRHCFELLD